MEDNKGTPVEILTAALAEITQRAMEAERQRDVEKARGDEWYDNWQRQGQELGKVKMQLEATEKIVAKLEAYIKKMEEGAPTNE